MTAFTPAMETALQQSFATVFFALKIELPAADVTLLDGSAVVAFGGDTYTGSDDLFGTVDSIDSLTDGTGDNAPALSIIFSPASDADAAAICSPTFQGSLVTLYFGAIDPATGEVIADPLPLFIGEVDQPVLTVDKGSRSLRFECASAFERLFSGDEGIRLSDSHHKEVWPGETGLANMTGIIRTIYWGVDRPASSLTYGGGFSGGSNAIVGAGSLMNGYAQL
jgi:hypothetical protein